MTVANSICSERESTKKNLCRNQLIGSLLDRKESALFVRKYAGQLCIRFITLRVKLQVI